MVISGRSERTEKQKKCARRRVKGGSKGTSTTGGGTSTTGSFGTN